jgi:hypothetical protein
VKLIDIGAFNGDSALHFVSYPDIHYIDAYDPNSDFKDIWYAIEQYYPTVRLFHNEAVYTNNGTITYYKRPAEVPLGSTVMTAKVDGEVTEVEVKCVDILDIIPDEPFCLKARCRRCGVRHTGTAY